MTGDRDRPMLDWNLGEVSAHFVELGYVERFHDENDTYRVTKRGVETAAILCNLIAGCTDQPVLATMIDLAAHNLGEMSKRVDQ